MRYKSSLAPPRYDMILNLMPMRDSSALPHPKQMTPNLRHIRSRSCDDDEKNVVIKSRKFGVLAYVLYCR